MALDFKGERLNFEIADPEDFMQHLTRYRFARDRASGTVLDLACGIGYGSLYLCDSPAVVSVVAADISEQAIGYGTAAFKHAKLAFRRESAVATSFPDGSFDTMVSLETIEHIPETEDFLREARRVLKKGGIFVVSCPNKRHFLDAGFRNDFHFHEMYLREFAELLGRSFLRCEMFYQLYPRERYERLRPKPPVVRQSRPGARLVRRLFPGLLPWIRRTGERMRYRHLAAQSVGRKYGTDFQRFMDENSPLRVQYEIVAAEEGLCTRTPGNFLAVCVK